MGKWLLGKFPIRKCYGGFLQMAFIALYPSTRNKTEIGWLTNKGDQELRPKLIEGVLVAGEAPVFNDTPVAPVHYLAILGVQYFFRTGGLDFEKSEGMVVGTREVVILYLQGLIGHLGEFLEIPDHRFPTSVIPSKGTLLVLPKEQINGRYGYSEKFILRRRSWKRGSERRGSSRQELFLWDENSR